MASSPTATPIQGVLLSHLPAVFQGPTEEGQLLRDFLDSFEEVLFGDSGLHSTIGSFANCLDARKAPVEFLPWLASWMGTTLYRQLPKAKQHDFVANASDYYRYRGTRHNLQRLLELFICQAVHIDEPDFLPFQVGVHSTIGSEAYMQGGPPHAFRVTVTIPTTADSGHEEASNHIRQIEQLARAVIDLEKPAHTTYELKLLSENQSVNIERFTSTFGS
jgi:phage tail-like protein